MLKHMILPYHIADGIPSMPDSLIRSLWNRLVEKKRPLAEELDSPEVFVDAMKRFKITLLGKAGEQPEGFVYVTQWQTSSMEGHFQFFCRKERALELAGEYLTWVFKAFPTLETVYGYVPVKNKKACRFSGDAGGIFVGVIPGKCWSPTEGAYDANLYIWRRP